MVNRVFDVLFTIQDNDGVVFDDCVFDLLVRCVSIRIEPFGNTAIAKAIGFRVVLRDLIVARQLLEEQQPLLRRFYIKKGVEVLLVCKLFPLVPGAKKSGRFVTIDNRAAGWIAGGPKGTALETALAVFSDPILVPSKPAGGGTFPCDRHPFAVGGSTRLAYMLAHGAGSEAGSMPVSTSSFTTDGGQLHLRVETAVKAKAVPKFNVSTRLHG